MEITDFLLKELCKICFYGKIKNTETTNGD